MPHQKERERERERERDTLTQPQTRVEFTHNSLIWLEYSEKSKKLKIIITRKATQIFIFESFRIFERN